MLKEKNVPAFFFEESTYDISRPKLAWLQKFQRYKSRRHNKDGYTMV